MKGTKENKTREYYLNKHYPFLVYPADEGGYVAEIEELPGCITQGETLEEVSARIEDARRAWIELAYEDGMEIPLPRSEQEYSGKFMVRMPRHLHRQLAEKAAEENVSLNQFVVTLLSGAVSKYQIMTGQFLDAESLRQRPLQIHALEAIASLYPSYRPWTFGVTKAGTKSVLPIDKCAALAQDKELV